LDGEKGRLWKTPVWMQAFCGESEAVRKCINVGGAKGENFKRLFAELGLLSKAEL